MKRLTKWHLVKSWPQEFQAVLLGAKTHEFRKNDRDYQVGDVVTLQEWEPGLPDGSYTGRLCQVLVTHIGCGGTFDIPGGYVVLSIRLIGMPGLRATG